jgi:hypothetical protein
MFRRHNQSEDHPSDHHHHARPTSSRHGIASRGYSTPHIRGATEEERLGLVKGDSNTPTGSPPTSKSMPALVHYDDDDDEDESDEDGYGYGGAKGAYKDEDKNAYAQQTGMYGHSITRGYTGGSSPPRGSRESEKEKQGDGEEESAGEYEKRRSRLEERRRIGGGDGDARRDPREDHEEDRPPPPPKHGRSYRRGDFI